jgi:hypothetical protein
LVWCIPSSSRHTFFSLPFCFIPSPPGNLRRSSLVSVGRGENPQLTIAGGCRVQERGQLRAWGTWNPRYARGGRFGACTQKSRRSSSVSVGPGKNPQLTMAGGCRVQERGQLRAWGTWNPRYARGGRFGTRTRNSSPLGLISVGHGENPQLTMAGGCRMQERGYLWAWGTWNPRCARGGQFGACT